MQTKPSPPLNENTQNNFKKYLPPITRQLSGCLKSSNPIDEKEKFHPAWRELEESLHEFEEDFQLKR